MVQDKRGMRISVADLKQIQTTPSHIREDDGDIIAFFRGKL